MKEKISIIIQSLALALFFLSLIRKLINDHDRQIETTKIFNLIYFLTFNESNLNIIEQF